MSSQVDAPTCLAFSPDSQKVACGMSRSGVAITHVDSEARSIGALVATEPPVIVVWSPDGRKVMTALRDNSLCCWDAISLRALGRPFQGHKESVLTASFLLDSSSAISLSRDGEIFAWETENGEITRRGTVSKYSQTIFVAALSVNGTLLVTSERRECIAWEMPTCVQTANISLPNVPLLQAAIIPNGLHQVVLAFGDMSFGIWDTKSKTLAHTRFEVFSGDSIPLTMAVSPDGAVLAVEINGDGDGHPTRFYDRMGKEIASPNFRCVRPFTFSPDGNSFAALRVGSDSQGGLHKLIISSVKEILKPDVSLDIPTTATPTDKGKQRQRTLTQGFFDESPYVSGSAQGRVFTAETGRRLSRETSRVPMRSTHLRRRMSKILRRIRHPRSRETRSSGREVHLKSARRPRSRKWHSPPFSKVWKRIRHPRSRNARSPERVNVPHAQAVNRMVVSRSRRKARQDKRRPPDKTMQKGRDQDRNDGDTAGYGRGDDVRSTESEIVYSGEDSQSVRAHGYWNIFWGWLCYKSF